MSLAEHFSTDYFPARARFREAAQGAGATLQAYSIAARGPNDEELTIDTATFDKQTAERTVVVSSGLHGAEGFLGSAVQLAWLSRTSASVLPANTRIVLLHALNPFGFAWRRRWNESNVDLNRNFLTSGETYSGSPPLYAGLDGLLNPQTLPSKWEPFLLTAALGMLWFGAARVAQTIPVGQYDFPQGLFFGGHAPEETHHIVAANLASWLGSSREVLHLDLHTGLGKFGSYQLLVDAPPDEPNAVWFARQFGAENVSANRLAEGPGKSGVIYASRGTWEKWCLARCPDRTYRFATAEFGTYSGPRVISALRAENRAYHHGGRLESAYEWTRAALVEAFAPRSTAWRERVVRKGCELIDRALNSISDFGFRIGD